MKIAVITGASSGMGREFVYAIDQDQSYQLDEIWVIARREDRLSELKTECQTPIRVLAMDLMERKNFDVYKALLEEIKPEIQVLVNAIKFLPVSLVMSIWCKQQKK